MKIKAATVPGTIHRAPTPVLNAVPTRPSVTQPLSADADEDSAATHPLSPRSARKKSLLVLREKRALYRPTARIAVV